MKLKLITIDFWNTLFTTDSSEFRNAGRWKVLLQTLQDLNFSFSKAQLDNVLTMSWQYYNEKWINEWRTPNATEVLTYIWAEMGFAPNANALDYVIDFFEKSILYFPPALEPGVANALEHLSKKYTLGIISDTGFSPGRIMTQLLGDIGIKKYFSGYSYSDETGVAKPHPKAFQTLLEMFNISPENALHIGDIERTDIEGAKNAGMYAVRYDGNAESSLVQSKNNNSAADAIIDKWNDIVTYLNA